MFRAFRRTVPSQLFLNQLQGCHPMRISNSLIKATNEKIINMFYAL